MPGCKWQSFRSCWWLKSGGNAPVEVGSLSHYLQGFSTIPGGYSSPDFWTINSMNSEGLRSEGGLVSSKLAGHDHFSYLTNGQMINRLGVEPLASKDQIIPHNCLTVKKYQKIVFVMLYYQLVSSIQIVVMNTSILLEIHSNGLRNGVATGACRTCVMVCMIPSRRCEGRNGWIRHGVQELRLKVQGICWDMYCTSTGVGFCYRFLFTYYTLSNFTWNLKVWNDVIMWNLPCQIAHFQVNHMKLWGAGLVFCHIFQELLISLPAAHQLNGVPHGTA